MTYLRGTELVDIRSGNKATVVDAIIVKDGRELFVLQYADGGFARYYESRLEKSFVAPDQIDENVIFVNFKTKIKKAV